MTKNMRVFGIAIMLIVVTSCSSGKWDVPEGVNLAFNQKFPNATEVEWVMESDNEWEAEFENAGVEYTANFDNKGSWLETERGIAKSELPAGTVALIETQFPSGELKEIELVLKPNGTFYELEVKQNDKVVDLVFSSEGLLLENNENEDDDGEDDDGEERGDDVDEDDDGEDDMD